MYISKNNKYLSYFKINFLALVMGRSMGKLCDIGSQIGHAF